MPEKHLFVNSSHYQDRPDPDMRQMIASHAAKYGPNGSMAFKAYPEGTQHAFECGPSKSASSSPLNSSQSKPSTPRLNSASVVPDSPLRDAFLRRDYESISARLSEFCICSEHSIEDSPRWSGKSIYTDKCTLLDDYLTLTRDQELPFRVATHALRVLADPSLTPDAEGLVLQCLLVAGQAGIDGLDPTFQNQPSKPTLALQQKALNAMQRAISKSASDVDGSILLASAIMLSVAAYFADHEEYRAHRISLQKLIEMQGGFNQTRTHGVVKALMAGGDISLAQHRYTLTKRQNAATKQEANLPQCSTQAPFKLKYPMPPFAPEIASTIERMSSGFQSLAEASKLSMQALQLLHLACKWSLLIDQSLKSEMEETQLLAKTAGANARLLLLYDESVQTKRIAALLLISLPADAAHMRLERCLCLGFMNLLHSVTLQPHSVPLRDRLVVDFAESILSLQPKDRDEEDTMIWLTLAVASEWRHCAAKVKQSSLPAQHGHDSVVLCQMWLQKSKQLMDWLVVKHERARAWDELSTTCSRFLWLRRLGPEWKQTWKNAMERRSRNMPRKRAESRCQD